MKNIIKMILVASVLLCSCSGERAQQPVFALLGATIIDGTGGAPIENGVVLMSGGRITAVGTREETIIPEDAEVRDVTGKTIIPGLIDSHTHVGDVNGIEPGHYSAENIRAQLQRYARYGFTTVVSLGGDGPEAEAFRAAVDTVVAPNRARLYIAGTVVTGNTPDDVADVVKLNADMGVDLIKIRVDDNLGTTVKMPEEIYKAVIESTHMHGLKLAAHLYYLDDAKKLLADGADFIAHSIRDQPVDGEVIRLFREKGVCDCPTLAREVSAFVYETTPGFFNDPFFLQAVDTSILRPLKDPVYQKQIRESKAAQTYKAALKMAQQNLKVLSDSGVVISFGTDTGVSGRFQGYFDHLEMALMAEAGLTPMQIILSATRDAARCLELKDVGTLEAGMFADLVILDKNPLQDIRNARSIAEVWIGGKKLELN